MVERPMPAVYYPMEQSRRTRVVLLASTDADPTTLFSPVRDELLAADASIVLYDVKTIEEHWTSAFFAFRLGAELGLAIGFLAAVMAAGGLYGIMAFRVGQRRREMGIRIALGARRERVLGHVMRGSLKLVIGGIGIGAVMALALSGVVEGLVFGVEPTSLAHLVGVGLGLMALALAATLVPAMGATRIDPLETIRVE